MRRRLQLTMKTDRPRPPSPLGTTESPPGHWHLRPSGSLDALTAAGFLARANAELDERRLKEITVDLSAVDRFDDFGATALMALKRKARGRLTIANAGEAAQKVLSLVRFDAPEGPSESREAHPARLVGSIGETALSSLQHGTEMVAFLGDCLLAFLQVLRRPRSLRLGDTLECMEKTGVQALPIVGLIGFLLGLVIAFMSSIQLQQFGANIYVASLVAIAMVSELGPIMTAIVVAGRSGSAFAAEIGTMKINEEIDALFIMGFSPTLFLAIPRILASLLVIPLLTIFCDLFAIAGGLAIGVLVLDLTVTSYLTETVKILNLFEFMWGFWKSVTFSLVVSWVSCMRGFQTRGGAAAVGNAATSAVVTSVFLIILVDSIFAVTRAYW